MKIELNSFRVAGYKAYPEGTGSLDLAPLTLVIGRNNAGKSALIRAPVLLAESLRDNSRLLSLNARGMDFGQTYKGIIHGVPGHGGMDFAIGATLAGRDIDIHFHLDYVLSRNHRDELVVGSFRMDQKSGAALQGLPLEVTRQAKTHTFSATLAGEAAIPTSDWDRLLPVPPRWLLEALGSAGAETLSILLDLRTLGDWVHHLGPFRAVAQRQYRQPDIRPVIATDGSGAVELLAWEEREGGGLLQKVSQWFHSQDHHGFQVHLTGSSEQAGIASLSLRTGSGTEVSFADAGSGVAQILPVVVRLLDERSEPTLQVIEQPELHLHPAACGALGDLFVNVVNRAGPKLLVETHSENLLLRIRRRIAEGILAADRVAIYWVENETGATASFRRLEVSADGWVEDWPAGVFAEDAEEARALARAMERDT